MLLNFINSLGIVKDLYIVDNSCSTYEVSDDFQDELIHRKNIDDIVEEKYKDYAKGGIAKRRRRSKRNPHKYKKPRKSQRKIKK